MNDMLAVIAGYAASVLLALSLLVNNDLKFRWLNLMGCLAFIVYGILINAFPIILTNTILLLINVFALVKTYNRKENFDLVDFRPGDKLVERFLGFHKKDINHYFPGFNAIENDDDICFLTLRDMVIANIFVAKLSSDGTAVVKLNYTVPKYRDYKVGTFLFQKGKQYLKDKGITQISYTSVNNKDHLAFLKRMGFEQSGEGMVKRL